MGGLISQLGNTYLRDFVTDGVPTSGYNDPKKSDGRAAFQQIDAAVADLALFSAIGVVFATQAAMNADLAHGAGTAALVWNDGTAANDGIYVKSGASGTGAWTATGIALPSTFATDLAALKLAAPWYSNASFAQVSQVKAALQAAGVLQTVINAIPAAPGNSVNQQWTSGGMCTQAGPLGAAIKTALGYSDGQMTTLFTSARTQAI